MGSKPMAAWPAENSSTRQVQRARFLSIEDGFNIQRPRQRPHAFIAEREAAFSPGESASFPLDQSASLGLPFAATTPLMLARYLRLTDRHPLAVESCAAGEVYVALQGEGRSRRGPDEVTWRAGDVFCLPGARDPSWHEAANGVLYMVCDEPAFRFLGAAAPALGESPIEAVHYPHAMITGALAELRERVLPADAPGRALNLSSLAMSATHPCLPSLTLTYNLVAPGDRQRPHHHNATALVLVLDPGGCHSVIGGERIDWRRHIVLLTPAGEVHEHANRPDGDWALALIAQDGGLHYHCRTMGFSFAEAQACSA